MPITAYGKVRHVGEVVAIVYADTQEQAEYAASRLKVTYESYRMSSAWNRPGFPELRWSMKTAMAMSRPLYDSKG